MAGAATTVEDAAGVAAAVDSAISNPGHLSAARRSLAAELFHDAGNATDRAIHDLYALLNFDLPAYSESAPHTSMCSAERAFSR